MEALGYRDVLEDILAFTEGRRVMTIAEVSKYTGLKDYRTIKKRYPRFENGCIPVPVLARLMCSAKNK